MDERFCICQRCIDSLYSRGEEFFVSNNVEEDITTCVWCNEEDEELREVIFK